MQATIRKYAFAIITALMVLTTMVLWRIYCSPWADDFVYSHVFDDNPQPVTYTMGPEIESFSQLVNSWVYHAKVYNGRLVNMLNFVMFLLPHWLVVLLCALACAALPFMMLMAAGGYSILQRRVFVGSAVLLCFLLLPWNDQMQSVVFLMNYVFTAIAMLAVLAMMPSINELGGWQYALMLFCCIFTAWGHELYGIALIAFLAISVLRGGLRRRQWICLVVAIAALGVGMLTGTYGRAMRVDHPALFYIYIEKSIIYELRYCWLMIPALIVAAIKHRRFNAAEKLRFAALAVSWLAAMFVVLKFGQFDRGQFCPIILCLMTWYMLADRLLPRRRSRFGAVTAWTLLGLWVCYSVALISWQRKLDGEYSVAKEAITKADCNVTFADITEEDYVPFYTSGIPEGGRYSCMMNQVCEPQLYGRPPGFVMVVAPKRYEGLPFEQWDKVPGRNPFRIANGMLVADTLIVGYFKCNVTYGDPLPAMKLANRVAYHRYRQSRPQQLSYERTYEAYPVGEYQGRMLYYYHTWQLKRYVNQGRALVSIDIESSPDDASAVE